MNTDRIERKILLHVPLERAWQAVSNARRFGYWFGVEFDEPFEEGAVSRGRIVPTAVDDDVAKMQKPHEGMPFEFTVERIEPMRRIAFRWHPFAIEPDVDYSDEPKTLIVFELKELPTGVLLTITESGFDKLPLVRRAAAFEANASGWEKQATLIEKYVAMPAPV